MRKNKQGKLINKILGIGLATMLVSFSVEAQALSQRSLKQDIYESMGYVDSVLSGTRALKPTSAILKRYFASLGNMNFRLSSLTRPIQSVGFVPPLFANASQTDTESSLTRWVPSLGKTSIALGVGALIGCVVGGITYNMTTASRATGITTGLITGSIIAGGMIFPRYATIPNKRGDDLLGGLLVGAGIGKVAQLMSQHWFGWSRNVSIGAGIATAGAITAMGLWGV